MKHISLLAAVLLAAPLVALAQGGQDPAGGFMTTDVSVIGGGWSQWREGGEIVNFVIDAAMTLLLASVIVLHPVRWRAAVSLEQLIIPRLFYIYALIGMIAGFLVDQHGYVIGFVIFGIGTLLRFRSNLDDPTDTAEMILVTLMGLCVGLNIPIMAAVICAVAWVVIALAGRHSGFQISVKVEDSAQLDPALQSSVDALQAHGWTIAGVHKSQAKAAADILIRTGVHVSEGEVDDALAQALGGRAATWKLRS